VVQVVWFKRDLRIHDHAPLTQATSRGPILAIYVYEPAVISAADFAAQHLGFINESLSELDTELRVRGSRKRSNNRRGGSAMADTVTQLQLDL
jgi:deoxyribodipyrimidine photo-lyase